jgi:hypothetical protein
VPRGEGGARADEQPEDEDGQVPEGTIPLSVRRKVTRFTAWKQLDPVRPGRAAEQIAEEILAQFTDRPGGRVKVVLEIEAEDPSGFDEATRRNVTENANQLGFGHHEFE